MSRVVDGKTETQVLELELTQVRRELMVVKRLLDSERDMADRVESRLEHKEDEVYEVRRELDAANAKVRELEAYIRLNQI